MESKKQEFGQTHRVRYATITEAQWNANCFSYERAMAAAEAKLDGSFIVRVERMGTARVEKKTRKAKAAK